MKPGVDESSSPYIPDPPRVHSKTSVLHGKSSTEVLYTEKSCVDGLSVNKQVKITSENFPCDDSPACKSEDRRELFASIQKDLAKDFSINSITGDDVAKPVKFSNYAKAASNDSSLVFRKKNSILKSRQSRKSDTKKNVEFSELHMIHYITKANSSKR